MGFVFKRRLVRVGGSIACPIPSEILKELGWKETDEVTVDFVDNKVVISK